MNGILQICARRSWHAIIDLGTQMYTNTQFYFYFVCAQLHTTNVLFYLSRKRFRCRQSIFSQRFSSLPTNILITFLERRRFCLTLLPPTQKSTTKAVFVTVSSGKKKEKHTCVYYCLCCARYCFICNHFINLDLF